MRWLRKTIERLVWKAPVSRRRVYIHEDDYCQQEILPVANWRDCAEQIARIGRSAQESFDGTSWGALVLREGPPKDLVDLGISVAHIRAILESRLPKYDLVQTGYGTHVEDCVNMEAFGLEGGFTVFVSYNAAGIVNAIWCSPWGRGKDYLQDSKNPILEVFSVLAGQFELLFVDWAWCRMFKLTDRHALEHYLDEHIHRLESTK